jgi:hypothetical protein
VGARGLEPRTSSVSRICSPRPPLYIKVPRGATNEPLMFSGGDAETGLPYRSDAIGHGRWDAAWQFLFRESISIAIVQFDDGIASLEGGQGQLCAYCAIGCPLAIISYTNNSWQVEMRV